MGCGFFHPLESVKDIDYFMDKNCLGFIRDFFVSSDPPGIVDPLHRLKFNIFNPTGIV